MPSSVTGRSGRSWRGSTGHLERLRSNFDEIAAGDPTGVIIDIDAAHLTELSE
ncbi:hypothetical protein ACFW6C_09490 [Streptomyces fungicidicus]|uniref:hypothetical protein n=1 Tax=Streptomyces fungicidicus TaxID=68203 RepID=UPI0033349AB2